MGERVIPRVLAGKSVRVIGDPDAAHSWTYITDVARALIALGSDERAWGRAWHTPTNPPMSQRQFIAALCAAANLPAIGVGTIPSGVTRALGLLVPTIREIAEIRYQLDHPFVVDSSAAQIAFGLLPTPMPEALTDTVSWYREPRTTKGTRSWPPATRSKLTLRAAPGPGESYASAVSSRHASLGSGWSAEASPSAGWLEHCWRRRSWGCRSLPSSTEWWPRQDSRPDRGTATASASNAR
jgi:hypothetical protein